MPVLGCSFFALEGECDLPAGLAGKASIKCDQCMMSPFVDGECRSTNGDKLLFGKAG
jgi:hypothetical protein